MRGDRSVAQGVDPQRDSGSFRSITVACGGCLSVVRFETETHEDAPITTELIATGAAVTRFRERVVGLRENGSLESSVPELLADPQGALLCGVPEVAKEILATGIGRVRNAKNAFTRAPWWFTVWGEAPWQMDRYDSYVDPDLVKKEDR